MPFALELGATTSSTASWTLHECRHTFASLLIDSGANPKAVQEFMGHSKIQTTFDVYGHLFPGSHDEVRARMDAYLGCWRRADWRTGWRHRTKSRPDVLPVRARGNRMSKPKCETPRTWRGALGYWEERYVIFVCGR